MKSSVSPGRFTWLAGFPPGAQIYFLSIDRYCTANALTEQIYFIVRRHLPNAIRTVFINSEKVYYIDKLQVFVRKFNSTYVNEV